MNESKILIITDKDGDGIVEMKGKASALVASLVLGINDLAKQMGITPSKIIEALKTASEIYEASKKSFMENKD